MNTAMKKVSSDGWIRISVFAAVALSMITANANTENGFDDVTDSAGLNGLGGGKAAWGDYNNDGWPDLCVDDRLWRNEGNGFVPVADVGPVGAGVWGDYDRDGFLDYFNYSERRLWRNHDGAGFIETTASLGAITIQNSRGAVWADLNGDRYLDLYISGYEQPTYQADVILTNRQGARFEQTWAQGVDTIVTPGHPRPGRGVTSADFDQDGDQDVLVSCYRLEPNGLWVNDGEGRLIDQAAVRGIAGDPKGSFPFGHTIGSAFGDLDNDGWLDIFIGNFRHAWGDGSQDFAGIYRNEGPKNEFGFRRVWELKGADYQESYASPTLGDVDNDGDLDFFFTTVYGGDHPRLYRNDGDFRFTDVTVDWGLAGLGGTYQAAFADYNADGYLDLATAGKLLRNRGGVNHYLKVRFQGNGVLDASAIGTQVRINLAGRTMTRQVESAVGESNQNDHVLHFGLASHTGPVELQIHWPGGAQQRIAVPQVDRTVTITATASDLRRR